MKELYINKYEFIKAREEVMKENDFACKMCGNKARIVHHIDGSRVNHSKENLIPLCDKCHSQIHGSKSIIPKLNSLRITSLIVLKGLSKQSFAELIGINPPTLSIILARKTTKNETVKKMANILKCEVEDLFTDEYKEKLHRVDKIHYPEGITGTNCSIPEEYKQMLIDIAKIDNRSISQELAYLINERHNLIKKNK